MSSHHRYPIFPEELLLLKFNRTPQGAIHRLLGVKHKAIEDVEQKLGKLWQEFVQETEKPHTMDGAMRKLATVRRLSANRNKSRNSTGVWAHPQDSWKTLNNRIPVRLQGNAPRRPCHELQEPQA